MNLQLRENTLNLGRYAIMVMIMQLNSDRRAPKLPFLRNLLFFHGAEITRLLLVLCQNSNLLKEAIRDSNTEEKLLLPECSLYYVFII